ncbi:cyclase family protein [Algibacter mikhailovii]|uniref:Cyclase n=1 Tax=Algibacter mikhailovii TaxID=425498 RepID=A0A918QZA5_9FLAO|nr:cyclase family protein [Algibacter mikhailovii]GGZ75475.1 cyclase [Algibacter mikhailovii]
MKIKTVYLLGFLALLISCTNSEAKKNEAIAHEDTAFYNRKIVDLTHEFSDETVYWVTAKEFEMEVVADGETDMGFYYAANNFTTAEHGGTHIDAPIHFAKGKQYVNEIPLENLMGSAIKIDVSEKALINPDYLVSIEDFTHWEKTNGMQIPDGSIVLLETGFSKYYPNKKTYLGTDQRGPEAVKLLHFPGLSPEAAQWLVDQRDIKSVGLDTPSIDYGQSQYFKSHVILLSKNIPAFENLTNLSELPSKGFDVVALPMKIKEGSGAPLRIIALVH